MSKIVEVNVGGVVMEFANYTPHDVVVYKMDGRTPVITVPKTGTFIRVAETVKTISEEGVPFVRIYRDPDKIEGLPPHVPGRYLIVSDITYQAAIPLDRDDLVRTGPAVRDDDGRIIGCKGLAI